jgi:hypothetical protein
MIWEAEDAYRGLRQRGQNIPADEEPSLSRKSRCHEAGSAGTAALRCPYSRRHDGHTRTDGTNRPRTIPADS